MLAGTLAIVLQNLIPKRVGKFLLLLNNQIKYSNDGFTFSVQYLSSLKISMNTLYSGQCLKRTCQDHNISLSQNQEFVANEQCQRGYHELEH